MKDKQIEEQPICFTEGALAELKRLQKSLEAENQKLRVGVKGGGCSGLSYLLAFDKAEEKDKHFEIQGVDVIMDPAHVMYVIGMEIDYQDGLNSRGFTFNNPNASETCGCGTSFAA